MAEHPADRQEHPVHPAVQLHGVRALDWHLQIGIAGLRVTYCTTSLSHLHFAPLQEGFPGGPLGGGAGGLLGVLLELLEAGVQPSAKRITGEAGNPGAVFGVSLLPSREGAGLRPLTQVECLGAGGMKDRTLIRILSCTVLY